MQGRGYQNVPNGGAYHRPGVPGTAHAPPPHRGQHGSYGGGHNGPINPPQRTPVPVTVPSRPQQHQYQQHGGPQHLHHGPRPQRPVTIPPAAAAAAAASKPDVGTGVFDTSYIMNALHQTAVPAAMHQHGDVPDQEDEEKKLSKSQKAKLRKKLREGKA